MQVRIIQGYYRLLVIYDAKIQTEHCTRVMSEILNKLRREKVVVFILHFVFPFL